MMHGPFSDSGCHKTDTVVNPPHIREQIIQRDTAVREKQCTWAALGSRTTLIGFGEVILTKGTVLWQSWQSWAWIIKTLPCHIRAPPITTTTSICSHRAQSFSCIKLYTKCTQYIKYHHYKCYRPIYPAVIAVITHFAICLPLKPMDAPVLTMATWNQHMGCCPLGVMGGANPLPTIGSLITSSWEAALSSHQQISL